jgi:sigma-54 dependent transcriptional regulator, acetoin dehydrogenase operon transcriptional activator AcoR
MISSQLLFLSEKNSIRGQIAAAFAQQIAPPEVVIRSAGLENPKPPPAKLITLLKEHQIELSQQKPQSISDLKDIRFDLVITLGAQTKENYSSLAGAPFFVNWLIGDHINQSTPKLENLKKLIFQIKDQVNHLFNGGYLESFVVQKKNTNRIFNSLSEGIIAHDLERKVFFFSQRASEITGLTEKEAMSRECHDIFESPLCGSECSCCNDGEINDFEAKSYNMVFHDTKGVRKECQINVIPMRDENGQIQGIVASLTDLTQQRSLERILGKEKIFSGIIGNDKKMRQIYQQIRNVATYEYPVHIQGDTGTGKELVAKALHNESKRKNKSFIPINCGAIPSNLVESELFGHVKGSFTGAIKDKAGRFELAEGGTVFLDEVADLPKSTQVKLLRFLQEGTFEKVGDSKTIKSNVWVVSATNLDLKDEIKQGHFREDLYYRLNVIPIILPLLKSRKNDIPLLCNHFLEKIGGENHQRQFSISNDAMSHLMDYTWPGNVRELENAIRFGIVRCQNNTILPADLPMEITQKIESVKKSSPSEKLNKQSVQEALEITSGNKVKAAKLLGVGRATLYRFFDNHPEL